MEHMSCVARTFAGRKEGQQRAHQLHQPIILRETLYTKCIRGETEGGNVNTSGIAAGSRDSCIVTYSILGLKSSKLRCENKRDQAAMFETFCGALWCDLGSPCH